jgi:hypothetical protein
MRLAAFAPAVVGALLLAACAREAVVTEDIVSTIPWPDQERADYVIVDSEKGEELLRGTLSVTRQQDRFELRLRFEDEGENRSDESAILVDAATLKPISVRREVRTEEVRTVQGDYDSEKGIVEITETVDEGEGRSVPLRLKDHYYDNESSLFLWRTIPFEQGYEASYHAVLANRNAQHVVAVEVVGREEVSVPAGTFQAWRVEIRTQGKRQTAWYADTPERILVQYDNSLGQLFQLTAYEP